MHKGAHVTVYLILMILFFMAINTWRNNQIAARLGFILTVGYAIFDEIHQGFTPNRTPYIGDVFLDAFGAAIGFVLLFFFKR
ncbi:VanZ family protein [Aquibacillus sp. 3ASR75-54]|uniref:VanZ family protein n=1 Tax=Aquibacillus salsiterrae TaxID=2950439 RepID=A0A9X3WB04_9BACI|nr:VanZ family protein [Aquibacillus salsiterrae]